MDGVDPILLKIDKLITVSRLKEMAFIVDTDITERITKMSSVLERLRPGAYLLGTHHILLQERSRKRMQKL